VGFLYRPKRKSKSGHVYEGPFYAGIRVRKGEWVRVSAGSTSREVARAFLHRLELRIAQGLPVRETSAPSRPLRAFLESHLESQRPALDASTYERYTYCLQSILADGSPLAGRDLADVNVGLCSQYVSCRLAQASKPTVAKEIAWFKAALSEAVRQDLVSYETVGRIRDEISPKRLPALRKANRARERVLLPNELSVLLEAAAENENLRDALSLAFWTGIRQENILELSEAQFDFTCSPAVIRFSPGQMKTDIGHLVRLAPKAREILLRRWVGDPANASRRFFSDFRPAWKRLRRGLEKSGALSGFRFHDLRRTYTTYRLAAGIDPKTVQDEVGHQDSRMTMDCYGRAVRDPAVRAWALEHFRWDADKGRNKTTVEPVDTVESVDGGGTTGRR